LTGHLGIPSCNLLPALITTFTTVTSITTVATVTAITTITTATAMSTITTVTTITKKFFTNSPSLFAKPSFDASQKGNGSVLTKYSSSFLLRCHAHNVCHEAGLYTHLYPLVDAVNFLSYFPMYIQEIYW
jgi:hypothetical protein